MKLLASCMVPLIVAVLTLNAVIAAEEETWVHLTNDAKSLYFRGQYKQALEVTKHALEVAKKQYGLQTERTAQSLGDLGALYQHQGNEAKGNTFLRQASDIRKKLGIKGIPLSIESEEFFLRVERRKSENGLEIKKKTGKEPPVQESVH